MIQPDLQELISSHQDPCVSIFMPVRHVRSKIRENPIRFKNLFARAEELLGKRNVDSETIENTLGPGRRLLQDPSFWRGHAGGLAMFLSPSLLRYFRIPIEMNERVLVADRFHLKPLLPCVSRNQDFFLTKTELSSIFNEFFSLVLR